MRTKTWVLFAVLMINMGLAALACAQTGSVYLSEEFNYISLDQMQAAGWTFTRPAGISVGSGAIVLDGVSGDCAIRYNNHFPTGIFDWKVESKSMWLGQGHSTNGVYVSTEKHSYSFSADGYYDEFAFYRDNVKILRFGNYQEVANQYFVMTMVRQANTLSLYFNGELKNTYIEEDTQQSAATGITLGSPWRGDAKYDYYQIGEPTAVFTSSNPTATPSVSTDSFPMVPVLVGGGIAAVVVGGIVVYYFFIAGGSSASAGASASSTGSGGGGPIIQEHPISPLSGEAPPNLSPQALADIALKYPPEPYPQVDPGNLFKFHGGTAPDGSASDGKPLSQDPGNLFKVDGGTGPDEDVGGQHVNPQADPQNTNIKPQNQLKPQNQPAESDQSNHGQSLGGQQKPPQGQQVDSDKSE